MVSGGIQETGSVRCCNNAIGPVGNRKLCFLRRFRRLLDRRIDHVTSRKKSGCRQSNRCHDDFLFYMRPARHHQRVHNQRRYYPFFTQKSANFSDWYPKNNLIILFRVRLLAVMCLPEALRQFHIRKHCLEGGFFRTAGVDTKPDRILTVKQMADPHLFEHGSV